MNYKWEKTSDRTDTDLLYNVLKFHHRGTYIRDSVIESRRFLLESDFARDLCDGDVELEQGQAKRIQLDKHQICSTPVPTRRRSSRKFTDKGRHSVVQINELLSNSCYLGKRGKGLDDRPYPSAGSLYTTEVMLAIFEPHELEPGIYHYKMRSHELERVTERSPFRVLTGGNVEIGVPAFAFVYFVNWTKSLLKYRYRGYRFALMEIGSIFQQAALVSTRMHMNNLVYNAFSDHEVAGEVGLSPRIFAPLAVQFFGGIQRGDE